MSNSKWDAFKLWLTQFIESLLPDSVRRQCLYTLSDRYILSKCKETDEYPDQWSITFEDMYKQLKD